MLGANKTISTQRLSSGSYADNLSDELVRWSQIKATAVGGYITKAKHLAHKMMSDRLDLKVSDRILWEDTAGNSRIFVVAGVADFEDELGQHMKSLIREVESELHTEVTWKTPSDTQTSYDPIFEEFTEGQDFDDSTLKVLLDPIESAKESFIKVLGEGKLQGIEWIMTVDLPVTVTDKDKFTFDGVTYDVKWIVPEPFQYLVGLSKAMDNYAG